MSHITSMGDTIYPEERILNLSFVQKLHLKQGEECQFYCDTSVRHLTRRKKDDFFYLWCREPSSGIHLHGISDFAAIIFRCYYTLTCIESIKSLKRGNAWDRLSQVHPPKTHTWHLTTKKLNFTLLLISFRGYASSCSINSL